VEPIRKGNAVKLRELDKRVKIEEAEAQTAPHYEVYGRRARDSDLMPPTLEAHRQLLTACQIC
jgi:hypothetical protein